MMKRIASLALLACCLSVLIHPDAISQTYRQWGRLEPGHYGVGFRVVLRTDVRRTFAEQTNHTGKENSPNHVRPLQFNIWYPAVKNDTAARMPYQEYVGWIGLIARKGQMNDEVRNAGKLEFYRYFMSKGVPREKLDFLMKMPTAVLKESVEEPGPFPVILFAPGIGESPIMHTILCEYLTSHGYFIVSMPSMGWFSREMNFTGQCLEAQTRDLEEALASLRDFPQADLQRIGIVGYSLGSCASLYLSMRNAEIDAVVSLDGSIGFKDRFPLVKSSPFFNPPDFTVPLLHINVKGNKRNDTSIIDSLKYSMRYIVGIRDFTHVNFTSFGMLAGVIPGFWKSVEQNAAPGYETMCRVTLEFLDMYVKRGKKRTALLSSGSADVRIDEPIVAGERQ